MAAESGIRLRSSALILVLSGLTLLLGFGVQVALAAALGTSREMDIFLVAVTLPTLLATVALTGFPFFLVPALKRCMAGGGESEAASLAAHVARRTALVAAVIVAAVVAAAGFVVHLAAPGFDAGAAGRAAVLLRIMVIGSFFDLLRGVLSAVEYSRERFLLPQLVPSLNHALLIVSALFLLKPFGLIGLAVAWSVGSVVMCLALLPALRGVPISRRGAALSRVQADAIEGTVLPILLVAGVAQATPVVDRLVASLLPAGSISYLGYGSKMLEILMRTIPMAVALGVFPVLSQHAVSGDRERFADATRVGLRWALLGAVPLALTVLVFRVPLVQTLFQRGAFDANATRYVADACVWYAAAFLPATVAYLLTYVCFALKRTWFLVAVGLTSLALTVVLDFTLTRAFGFVGVALACLSVSTVQAAILAGYLQRGWRAFRGAHVRPVAVQAGVACAAMAATWAATGTLTKPWSADFPTARLALDAGAGLGVFVLVLWSLGNPEARSAVAAVGRRLRERRPMNGCGKT